MKLFVYTIIVIFAILFPNIALAQIEDNSVEKKATNITTQFILLIVGLILVIFYRKSNFFLKYGLKYRKWIRDEDVVLKTKYDHLELSDLEKIVTRLISNFRILTTIFAVLFAFIISTNLDRAFSNWAFIIWTGWILAIVVRTGITSLDLSDVLEIDDNAQNIKATARKIFAFKSYVKHSMYLLVPAIAFLPVFYFEPIPPSDLLSEWTPEIAIVSIAWGIMGMFLFVYWFAVRVSDFIYSRGNEGYYIFAIILLVFGAISLVSDSPLEPKLVTFFDIEESIPNVFFLSVNLGFIIGMIGIIVVGQAAIGIIVGRKKGKRKGKQKG